MTEAVWTGERLEELRALVATRLSAGEIAARMGVSRNAVIGACHRKGIQLRGGGKPPMTRRPVRLKAAPKPRTPTPPKPRPTLKSPPRALFETPPAPVKETPPPLASEPVALPDLRDCHCRWPLWPTLGDTPFSDKRYCGAPRRDGGAYCDHHRAAAESR